MKMRTKHMRMHPCTTAAACVMPCVTWMITMMAQPLMILKVLQLLKAVQ